MIIQSKADIPEPTGKTKRVLPVIPVRSAVLFPGQALTLQLNRIQNLTLLKEYAARKRQVAVVYSPAGEIGDKRFDLCQIGCAARIVSVKKGIGNSKLVVLEGVRRIWLDTIQQRKPYLTASAYNLTKTEDSESTNNKFEKELYHIVENISGSNPVYAESLLSIINLRSEGAGRFSDRITATFQFPVEIKQDILETVNIEQRLRKLNRLLSDYYTNSSQSSESGRIPHSPKNSAVLSNIPIATSHYNSLNAEVRQSLIDEIKANKRLPDRVREKCLIELDRLKNLSTASAEFGATRQYLDWLLNLPWNHYSESDYDLNEVEKVIDSEYYGPKKIKARVLERIAIRKISGKSDDASVLCLAGVSGTGKASLGKAIANSLGKEFVRVSVGGFDEVDDIKGLPRTYLNAVPGLFVRALKDCKTMDPVIYIENLDYLAEDGRSGLAVALLEAIDPRLNHKFTDDYLGLPVDLSRAFIIISVRATEDIPELFIPRLEIIDLPGYIEKEKIHIVRKYIIPKLLKKNALLKKEVLFNEKGLLAIIRNFTLEAGILNLKRKLELICRQIAKDKSSSRKKRWIVNQKTVENYLGTPEYALEKPNNKPEIGVATGLAWTGLGGDLMMIEALKMKGSGEVISTGSLGEVMKESIQASHSYVRSKADVLGIDHSDFDNFDIHIHFPSGAIPKDGPSAGVTICLVIASVMAERPIPNDIAMTGEVTLRGKVLQVGGLIEKISAAYRAGIPTVFLPKDNEKELNDLPRDILEKTKFVPIRSVDEMFEAGLKDFVPSTFTLEKLFAQEIEKVKNQKGKKTTGTIAAKGRKKK